MKRPQCSLDRSALVGVLAVAMGSVAWAANWGNFDPAFPGLPCNDGWAACQVEGTVVSPGMVLDQSGRPHPGNMRVGFFEFDALPAFSPFAGLSEYQGDPETSAGPVREVRSSGRSGASRASQPVASSGGGRATSASTSSAPVSRVGNTNQGTGSTSSGAMVSSDSSSLDGQATRRPDRAPLMVEMGGGNSATGGVEATPQGGISDLQDLGRGQPAQPIADPAPINSGGGAPVADLTVSAPPKTVSNDCNDLVALEAPAMMGQLGDGRRTCLEGALASSSVQTQKNKISRVLIADAEARGDQKDWEGLMKRHLQDIDRSDPNLCFKYAIFLSRSGVGRANAVIRWADYALENKQQWSGNTYKRNVYGLYKLRAHAANKLWQNAESKYVEKRNDTNEAKASQYRGMTKSYAREWLDYARASSQDIKGPLAVCVSAAGSKEFCEG